MSTRSEQDPAVRDYLLGNLDERTHALIEDRLFGDKSFLEELEIVEDELIDDYLRGRLSSDDRDRFKGNFLVTKDRQAKLYFSALLNDHVDKYPTRIRPTAYPWWQSILGLLTTPKFAIAAVAVVLLIVVGASYLRQQRPNNELVDKGHPPSSPTIPALGQTTPTQPDGNQQALKPNAPQQQPSSSPAKSPKGLEPVFAIHTPTLLIGASRSEGGMQQVDVPRNAAVVDINLGLPTTDYKRFKATLLNDRYQTIVNRELSRAKAGATNVLVFPIRAKLIPAGEYQIQLSGVRYSAAENIGSYSFRVRRP